MIKLLPHLRRPDISFQRNGIIRIAANAANILNLHPGDSINIAVTNDEYLLYAIHPANNIGRRHARCYPTKKGSNNYIAHSAKLCQTIFAATTATTDKVAYMTGEAFVQNSTTYLPIIIQHPL